MYGNECSVAFYLYSSLQYFPLTIYIVKYVDAVAVLQAFKGCRTYINLDIYTACWQCMLNPLSVYHFTIGDIACF